MAGSSNFLPFNASLNNADSDTTYAAQQQRQNGLQNGQAITTMHNKLYSQLSQMVAAIAQAFANAGYTVEDSNFTALQEVIDNLAILNPTDETLHANVTGNVIGNAAYVLNRPNRNAIINGQPNVWQRATAQYITALAVTSGGVFLADRWEHMITGSSDTASQQTFTPGQGVVPYEPQYWLRDTVVTSAGSGNFANRSQKIEDVRTYAGQTVTLSFWAQADAPKNMAIEFVQCFGIGLPSPSANVTGIGSQLIALTTSWQQYSITITIPSINGKTIGGSANSSYLQLIFWFDAGTNFNTRTASLGQQSGTFDICEVQLEPGPNYTGFELRRYADERQACQRYCRFIGDTDLEYFAYIGPGIASNATTLLMPLILPAPMRTAFSTFSAAPSLSANIAATSYEITAAGIQGNVSCSSAWIVFTTTSLTTGAAYSVALYSGLCIDVEIY